MEDYTTPLTRQQVQDLAVAATSFIFDMRERHPNSYIKAEIHGEGIVIWLSSVRAIRFLHGQDAYQPLYAACKHLDEYCTENNFEPRLLLPEWAQWVDNDFDPEIVSHQSLIAAGWKKDGTDPSKYYNDKNNNTIFTGTTNSVFGIVKLHLWCVGWRDLSILSRGPITLMADIQKEFNIMSQYAD